MVGSVAEAMLGLYEHEKIQLTSNMSSIDNRLYYFEQMFVDLGQPVEQDGITAVIRMVL